MLSLKETTQAIQHKNILAWIVHNNIKTETGQPFDFHDHRYLIDIYLDNSKYLCSVKAGQIGFSNMAILKTLWMAHYLKIDIGYILPTVEMVQKFVGSKVNRLTQQNAVLGSWTKDKDSITQKQIGENYIHYLGAMTERSAIMLALDMLVADEYDKALQEILEIYDSRLQHSKHGYKWVFSNPTIPDFGVDKYWKISDQKKWHIKHPCGKEYVLDEGCIDYESKIFRCPQCKKEITDDERRMGRWIATSKGEWSGYWIPLWINTMNSAAKICEYKRTKTHEYFQNFVCGLPFTGSGNKVNASTIIKCISPKVNDQTDRVIIGVDTGLPIHYTLCNKQGFFFYGKCSDPLTGKDPYLELEALLKRFPNSIMVSDQGGDLIGIRNLVAKYPGRVFLAWYRADRKTTEIADWGKGTEYGKVIIDRNRAIQWFVDEMTDKRVVYNGTESDWQEYISHWLNIYRTWEKDESGQIDKIKGFKWERSGPDHYCFIAGTQITTDEGDKSIEDIQVGDNVLTRRGWKKVVVSNLIRDNQEVVTAYFSNGSILIGTPDHPIITNNGQVRLDCITHHSILYSCQNQKLLFTRGLLTGDTQILVEGRREFILSQMEHLENEGFFAPINRYGLITMAIFLRAMSFITKMVILSTTRLQTWLVRQNLFTKAIMQKINMGILVTEKDRFNIWQGSGVNLTRGEKPPQGRSGIADMLIKQLSLQLPRVLYALSAILRRLHIAEQAVSFVPQDVRIVGLHENIEKKAVINLEVDGQHEYFANKILVSNCHAALYARVGLDKYATTLAQVVGATILDEIPMERNPELL